MQPVSAFVEEEIMPPNEIAEKGLPETPILEKSQREWTSDRCKATNENETTWKQACLSQNIQYLHLQLMKLNLPPILICLRKY